MLVYLMIPSLFYIPLNNFLYLSTRAKLQEKSSIILDIFIHNNQPKQSKMPLNMQIVKDNECM